MSACRSPPSPRKRVYELRDQLKTKYSRSAANDVLKLLRILFDWGTKRDLCEANPAAKVDNIRRPKDANVVNRCRPALSSPGVSFHGLRHTLGTRLAEAGCDASTIASVLGRQTTQMAEHYSRTARRHHLPTAAIERIEERDRNEFGKRNGKPTVKSLERH